MKTKVDILLNGKSINDIDSRIIIQRVNESKPQLKNTAVSLGGHVGQLVTVRERQYIDISISFAIAEKSDLAARAMILNAVNAWAYNGGTLETNYRIGQKLEVECESLPDIGYVRAWNTSDYTISFRAYNVPYWQSITRTSAQPDGNTAVLYVDGTAETPLELEVTANSETTGVRVSDDRGNTLDFAGLSMAEGDKLTVEHMGAIMVAKIGNDDALRYRTTASADEITLHPGNNTLTVEITGDAAVKFYARGRLL